MEALQRNCENCENYENREILLVHGRKKQKNVNDFTETCLWRYKNCRQVGAGQTQEKNLHAVIFLSP